MKYTQLTQEERYPIYALLKASHTQTGIAMLLNRHKSTISREIQSNTGLRGYRPQQAQGLSNERQWPKAHPRINNSTCADIIQLLQQDWSPEQISLWLKAERSVSISHEWIYPFLLQDKLSGGPLYRHLPCQKQGRNRYGRYKRRGQLIDRVSIDGRPSIVDQRQGIGDWELDTLIAKGHRQAIVSLTERKSSYTLMRKVKRKTADSLSNAIIQLLTPLVHYVKTLTSGNAKELADHNIIAQTRTADVYFAHSYTSWERGLNKNTTGLIRQYFPTSRDFTALTQKQINQVMDKVNNRPRKCPSIKTPNQVLSGINPAFAFVS